MHRNCAQIRLSSSIFHFLHSIIRSWEGEPHNAEPDKCDELAWYPIKNLPVNTIPYIKSAIESYQKGDIYSEIGWK